MTMPFYVAPEQFMKDKADFARKNIARGRPLVATVYAEGILICAENQSKSLHKVSEIYDRIAFAGVGRYNEFDSLRRAGVQHADLKGYQFSREDVDARSLANLYAQYMGNVFTHEMKPLEVEILVAEVGTSPAATSCSTSSTTVRSSTRTATRCSAARRRPSPPASTGPSEADWDLGEALRAAAAALAGPDRAPVAADLEVAILARTNGRRAFQRLDDGEVAAALAAGRPCRRSRPASRAPPAATGRAEGRPSHRAGGPGPTPAGARPALSGGNRAHLGRHPPERPPAPASAGARPRPLLGVAEGVDLLLLLGGELPGHLAPGRLLALDLAADLLDYLGVGQGADVAHVGEVGDPGDHPAHDLARSGSWACRERSRRSSGRATLPISVSMAAPTRATTA